MTKTEIELLTLYVIGMLVTLGFLLSIKSNASKKLNKRKLSTIYN